MPGATGREVVILDLYPGTGKLHLLQEGRKIQTCTYTFIARGILAKEINVMSLSGKPVAVICNPTEVRSPLNFSALRRSQARLGVLIVHVWPPNVDFD